MTAAVAVGLIDLYQQYLSPYKGFCCAHRVKHGRASCSQFAKRLIAKVGLLRFGPILLRRFERCGEAARALKARATSRHLRREHSREDRRKRENWTQACDGCDPVPDVSACTPDVSVPGSCDVPDLAAGGCDGASGCDCGGCDLSL
jgi:putative component of membrane protein insertase Oxa1/YidC/SpoIIIJ protein YidD